MAGPVDLLAGIRVQGADVQAATAAGNALTVDFLKQLEQTNAGGNFVDSAYSLGTALAMLELGARGDTEAQIASTLHSAGVTPVQQAAAWKQFDANLLATAAADKISLDVANAVWLQQGMPLNGSFLDTLVENFSAPSSQVDFQHDAQGAADLINKRVSDATQGMIPKVVSAQDVQDLRLLLADGIYFDANWEYQFILNNTSNGSFFRPDNSQVSVPLMHSEALTIPVSLGDGVTAAEMPYTGGHYVADIIMPTSQPIAEFINALTPVSLTGIERELVATHQVFLTLPRFAISSQLSLQPVLTALGMANAFSTAADFSGIDGRTDIHVGLATQSARIQVDELGTTATAATLIGGLGGGCGDCPPPTKVVFDHPFLFLIRDTTSGAILFTAQESDPTASS